MILSFFTISYLDKTIFKKRITEINLKMMESHLKRMMNRMNPLINRMTKKMKKKEMGLSQEQRDKAVSPTEMTMILANYKQSVGKSALTNYAILRKYIRKSGPK